MELYKLELALKLVRVKPPEMPTSAPPLLTNYDPMQHMGEAMEKMMEKVYPKYQSPEAQVTFRRTYDLQADSLADAAALLKKFEGVAEDLGVPAEHPLPVEVGGGFPFGTIGGR